MTLAVLVAIRGVVAVGAGVLYDLPLILVPVLFMWAPVWWLRWRGEDPDRYPLSIPTFSETSAWAEAAKLSGLACLICAPPFVVGYHLWQTWAFPEILGALCGWGWRATCGLALQLRTLTPAWQVPPDLLSLVAYHLLFVAIPEELFYRGYMQSRLDEVWPPRWRVGGALLGPGWLLTCVVFALGHSLVVFQWWHVFIVFPALVFGWMRAKTGGILAGAFFHAACNIAVGWLDRVYGLIA